jgi:hypothetical protein
MRRFGFLLLLLALSAAPAMGGGADLSGAKYRVQGDLRGDAGETDGLSFVGAQGSRLKLTVRTGPGTLEPAVLLFGPDGEVPLAAVRSRSGLRAMKSLPADGIYRLEIGGDGTGQYVASVSLAHPRRIRRTLDLGKDNGVRRLSFAVPGPARIEEIKASARGGTVRFISLRGPGDAVVDVESVAGARGFALRVTEPSGPGVHELALQGSGTAVVAIRLSSARPLRAEIDLRDGTEPTPAPGPGSGRAGEVLVKLSGGARLDRFLERYGSLLLSDIAGTGYARCRVPDGQTESQFLATLAGDHDVVSSERNLLVAIPEGSQSSLPVLDDNLDDAAVLFQPAGARIGLPVAHTVTLGQGVVIAVVDTGVDPDHPFFAGRLLPGLDLIGGDADSREERDLLDNDGDGLFDEGYGHGTFIAGLALAAAPEALILPVRVLDSDAVGDSATVAMGIVMAVDLGADIVNLSLGATLPMEVIREAMKYADERGVPVVVAAGNEADQLLYPARYALALAVTATDLLGVAAPFTNFGSQADLAAPGMDLAGPVPADSGAPFARWSGTSFAAPLVSGSLALVMRRFPVLNVHQQLSRLLGAVEDISWLNPGVDLGRGLVRPDEAVR